MTITFDSPQGRMPSLHIVLFPTKMAENCLEIRHPFAISALACLGGYAVTFAGLFVLEYSIVQSIL